MNGKRTNQSKTALQERHRLNKDILFDFSHINSNQSVLKNQHEMKILNEH